MFRRDPALSALDRAGEVLGRDLRPLRGLLRATLRHGGVLAVSRGGRRFIVGLHGVPGDGVFELASVTKPFTAALAGVLVSEGRLEWDRPLAALGGPLRRLPRSLTPRALATHTAGLPYHPARVGVTNLTHFHDPYGPMTPAAALSSARRWARPVTPARFGYSNLGVGVLGLALAHAAGEELSAAGYGRALERHVTGPLGLASVSLTPPDTMVTPRGLLGGASTTAFGPLAAAGGLSGAAHDLLTFGEAHLGEQYPHWYDELRPRGLPPLLRGVDPGWFVSGPAGVRWHDGVARGTRTGLAFDPGTGAVAALLARGGLPVLGPRAGVPVLLLALLAQAAKGEERRATHL